MTIDAHLRLLPLFHQQMVSLFNDNTPLFNWDDVTDGNGINRYTLQWPQWNPNRWRWNCLRGADTILTQDVNGLPPASQFRYAGTPLTEGTQYFWHVPARDRDNNIGLYSGTFSFTIDTLYRPARTITSPTAGTRTPRYHQYPVLQEKKA